jgi:hypothetical protein
MNLRGSGRFKAIQKEDSEKPEHTVKHQWDFKVADGVRGCRWSLDLLTISFTWESNLVEIERHSFAPCGGVVN